MIQGECGNKEWRGCEESETKGEVTYRETHPRAN